MARPLSVFNGRYLNQALNQPQRSAAFQSQPDGPREPLPQPELLQLWSLYKSIFEDFETSHLALKHLDLVKSGEKAHCHHVCVGVCRGGGWGSGQIPRMPIFMILPASRRLKQQS